MAGVPEVTAMQVAGAVMVGAFASIVLTGALPASHRDLRNWIVLVSLVAGLWAAVFMLLLVLTRYNALGF